jgi:hypothetical protein
MFMWSMTLFRLVHVTMALWSEQLTLILLLSLTKSSDERCNARTCDTLSSEFNIEQIELALSHGSSSWSVVTTGDPAYAVCLRHTTKEEKRTANISPCVCGRQTTHGNERHGEHPMPCAIPKTHGVLFAVCCPSPHGKVKRVTPPRRRRRPGVGRECSLPSA